MKHLAVISLCLCAFFAGGHAEADAADGAFATTNVNLRAGPSTRDRVIGSVGGGDELVVLNCLQTRPWCDVDWYGTRGWISSAYIGAGQPAHQSRHASPRTIRHAEFPRWISGGGLVIGIENRDERRDWREDRRHREDKRRYERRERRAETRWERSDRPERDEARSERRKDHRKADRRKAEYRKELRKLTRDYERKKDRLERKWR